jgi:hypothetical protein
MPNHITNIVTISNGSIQDILKIVDSSGDTEGSKFDFNRIIPMPQALIDTPSTHYPDSMAKEKAAQEALVKANIEQYGYATWYEFASDKWGTKWNAYDIEVQDDAIQFDTAWAMPDPIFVALSKLLPERTITVKYADEDIGSNCGIVSYNNGEVVSFTDMSEAPEEVARSFACEIKYNNADEWKTWEDD